MLLLPLFLSAAPLKSQAYFPDEAAKEREHRPDLGATSDNPPGQGNDPAATGPESTSTPKSPASEADLRRIEVLALVEAPANDNFANATVIPEMSASYPPSVFYGDNINATKEPGEPNHAGNPGGRSVWWKWTASAHARVSLYSSPSNFDTVLAVYTGQAVNALTVVAPFRFTVPMPEAYIFDAPAGTTYYFAVDGLNGALGNITLSLGALIATPPVITSPPQDVTVEEGSDTTLLVEAGGTGPFNYQWYFNGSALDHGTSPGWLIFRAKPSDTGNYHVVVYTAFGTVTSATARVTVTPDPRPVITVQPPSQGLPPGYDATFKVTATGAAPLSYQWLFNGSPIAAATGPTLTLTNIQEANAGAYTVTVSNAAGSVTSNNANLTVLVHMARPVITQQPLSYTVPAGSGVTFNVTATSSTPLTYQWFYNSAQLANATGSSLILSNAQAAHAGTYSVNVSNTYGTTASSVATLTVTPVVVVPPSASSSSGGGGAPTWWSLVALSLLVALRKYQRAGSDRVGG